VSSILLLFCKDPPTTEIYTLSLHDALPISLLSQTLSRQRQASAPVHRPPAGIVRMAQSDAVPVLGYPGGHRGGLRAGAQGWALPSRCIDYRGAAGYR